MKAFETLRYFRTSGFMWSNFHTHSHYCDGKGKIVDYLEAANAAGVEGIGFSSHAPLPIPCKWCMRPTDLDAYLQEIDAAARQFPMLQVYRGLEVDYIPEMISPSTFSHTLDFTVGSIHFVESHQGSHWEIDNTIDVFREGLRNIFRDDVRAAVARYLELTRGMLIASPPDILGHLDKIKVNARHFGFDEAERWYRDEMRATINIIAETNSIVEVNTRGLYKKKSDTTYPSPWILEQLQDRNVRVTISSDAHHPDDLTREFGPTLGLLRYIGFKYITALSDGAWKEIPLAEYGPA